MKQAGDSGRLRVTFWGVRGSTPTPRRENLGFGGNTACLQVETAGEAIVIFDAGTGIRNLGLQLKNQANGRPLDIHLFFTHFHWDHILGLPFFAPLYEKRNSVTIYSSSFSGPLRPSISGIMTYPYFPVQFDSLPARIQLVEVSSNDVRAGNAEVGAFPVYHPQGACGYRIHTLGATVIYTPDREPGDEELDRIVNECARGADLLIHDSNYTPEEYPTYRGQGHSSWTDTVRVACDSQVKRLVLFHHDPQHNDEVVTRITSEAQRIFPNTEAAREGASIEI